MALLTPHDLTQIWAVAPTAGTRFGSFHNLRLADGWTAICGVRPEPAPDEVGLTLVEYDTSTGEPLSFTKHSTRSGVTGANFSRAVAFPDTATTGTIVIVGYATGPQYIFGQQIAYDLTGPTLTGGTVVQMAYGNLSGVPRFAFPDADTVHVFYIATTSGVSTGTMNLAAGTAGAQTGYSPTTLTGGTYDRVSGTVSGDFPTTPGVVLVTFFNNATGFATGASYSIQFTSTIGTVTSLGREEITSVGSEPGRMVTSAIVRDAVFGAASAVDVNLDTSGTVTDITSPDVFTDSTIFTGGGFPALDGNSVDVAGQLLVLNREGTGAAGDDAVARLARPLLNTEQGAWRFPGVYTDYGNLGALSPDYRFFFDWRATNDFRVHEDPDWPFPAGRQWWLGVAGWSGN